MSIPKMRKIDIRGMTCSGCEREIEEALLELNGVKAAKADHEDGQVQLEYDLLGITLEEIEQTIAGLGYELSDGLLARFKRGMIHDAEQTEKANFLSGPALCCSKKAEQIVNRASSVRSTRPRERGP